MPLFRGKLVRPRLQAIKEFSWAKGFNPESTGLCRSAGSAFGPTKVARRPVPHTVIVGCVLAVPGVAGPEASQPLCGAERRGNLVSP